MSFCNLLRDMESIAYGVKGWYVLTGKRVVRGGCGWDIYVGEDFFLKKISSYIKNP